ncbi:metal-dependent hydrolase [Cellulosilyticum sp. WCF-2]|uniref:metal-dependent hydrolase n=1 Tax=Cellulosilyticum sp. WCF-2 TaxID=2497860 RepID=UPI000F8E8F26|nr:metal-dependent hydrolase [Cellulosilyticum sp. WCF-2]QEH68698.1 metal-dependent hydrolase [Cellulosilyticum sp. WCF-2]
MDGKTHLAAGIITGVGVVYLENKLGFEISPSNLLFIVGCAAGSLLPDIDIDNSMLGRFIPGWLFWEHRTVTHSIFFMVVLGLIGLLFKMDIGLIIGLVVGAATHLILDGITPMGLPYLLFPFVVKKTYRKEP